MKHIFKNKKAFTLIELLIVIAIIGILFIVLVSKVDFATDKAKATGVQTDFRSFQVAIDAVAKENAGLATFGWDTGDTNGDRVRNSYDKGDTNKNGVQDDGEVFVGSKAYGETWTNVYTLTNPADANDKSAIFALESAINKNLDPKLHITIHDDYTITMANQAQDPWKVEYHGYYITNALNDGKDRGAIIIYSNGANQEWGSEHSISNGVVTVTVPGNNINGKDDMSIVVIFTYANGYGEVKASTTGFSNNQSAVVGAAPNVSTPSQPSEPTCEHVDDNTHDHLCDDCGMFMYYDYGTSYCPVCDMELCLRNEELHHLTNPDGTYYFVSGMDCWSCGMYFCEYVGCQDNNDNNFCDYCDHEMENNGGQYGENHGWDDDCDYLCDCGCGMCLNHQEDGPCEWCGQ